MQLERSLLVDFRKPLFTVSCFEPTKCVTLRADVILADSHRWRLRGMHLVRELGCQVDSIELLPDPRRKVVGRAVPGVSLRRSALARCWSLSRTSDGVRVVATRVRTASAPVSATVSGVVLVIKFMRKPHEVFKILTGNDLAFIEKPFHCR